MKNKISFFIDSLDGGGAEKVFKELVNDFASRNEYIVELILVKKKGVFIKDLNPKIHIIDLSSKRTLFSILNLIKYLNKTNTNLIISTQMHVNIVLVLSKIISFNKTFVAIRESSTPSILIKNVYKNIILRKLIIFALILFYKFNKIIICPSEGVSNDLIENFYVSKSKIKIIYNPINFKHINIKKNEPINNNFFNSDAKMLISIGRLDKYKNHVDIIEVFKKIYKNYNIRLAIFGDGPEENNLKKIIKLNNLQKFIQIFKFNDNPYKYLQNSNLFISTSLFEGFPNSMLEAICMGIPCISYNCKSGPSEMFENEKFGTLVDLNDKNQLMNKITNFLDEEQIKSDYSKLKDKYNISTITQNYASLINYD